MADKTLFEIGRLNSAAKFQVVDEDGTLSLRFNGLEIMEVTSSTLDFQSGTYNFYATASGPAALRLYEDSDNGLHYVGLLANSSMAASYDLSLPNAQGAVGQVLMNDGSGNLGWSDQNFDLNGNNLVMDDNTGIEDDSGNLYLNFQKTVSAVNYLEITNQATGSAPSLAAAGSDTNIDVNIIPKGTGNVVVSDGTDSTKQISFEASGATTAKAVTIASVHTDDRTVTLPDATDTLVGRATTDTLTNKSIDLTNNTLTGTTAEFNTALSDGSFTTLAGTETLTNKTINTASNTITVVEADISDLQSYLLNVVEDTTPQLGGDLDTNSNHIQFDDAHGIQDDSGNEQLYFSKAASAVNYFQMSNAATGNAVDLAAIGSDTNIDISLTPKGTGAIFASAGISFDSGTNKLDEYEQGTWTPALAGSSTAGSHTYSVQNGRYIRIGNQVICNFYIDISSKDGSMAGDIRITGLPFTSLSNTGQRSGAGMSLIKNINFVDMLTLRIIGNVTYIRLEDITTGTGGSPSTIAAADVGTAPGLQGTVFYEVA